MQDNGGAYTYDTIWRDKLILYNWKDLLTAYNGKAISYDEIGNPETYDGWTYTWQAGRQLAEASKTGTNVQYAYNASGLRVQKTVNGVVTDYTLHGKLVTGLKQGTNKLHFFYDAQSRPAMVDFNGTMYYYVHNLQGDIIRMVDNTGAAVVEYKYDAWGKPIGAPRTLTTAYERLANLNPFRYRGYVWDEETGLYYLRSRYYRPEWGRFVNADSMIGKVGELLSHNGFAYCENDPLNTSDPSGYEAIVANSVGQVVCLLLMLLIESIPNPERPDYRHRRPAARSNSRMEPTPAPSNGLVPVPIPSLRPRPSPTPNPAIYRIGVAYGIGQPIFIGDPMTVDAARKCVSTLPSRIHDMIAEAGLRSKPSAFGIYTQYSRDAYNLARRFDQNPRFDFNGYSSSMFSHYNIDTKGLEAVHFWFSTYNE